jgi:hypothetical protein
MTTVKVHQVCLVAVAVAVYLTLAVLDSLATLFEAKAAMVESHHLMAQPPGMVAVAVAVCHTGPRAVLIILVVILVLVAVAQAVATMLHLVPYCPQQEQTTPEVAAAAAI